MMTEHVYLSRESKTHLTRQRIGKSETHVQTHMHSYSSKKKKKKRKSCRLGFFSPVSPATFSLIRSPPLFFLRLPDSYSSILLPPVLLSKRYFSFVSNEIPHCFSRRKFECSNASEEEQDVVFVWRLKLSVCLRQIQIIWLETTFSDSG